MPSIISRRLVAVGITAAAVAVSGAPAAHASKKSEKKQNAAIKKVSKATSKVNTKANAAKTAAAAAATAAAGAKTAADAADKKGTDAGTAAKAANDGVAAILSQVPTITDALKKLADGLTAAGAGLTALQTAVTQVATSQEYGTVGVLLGTSAGGAFAPLGLTSSDIPDDGNTAGVSGELPVVLGSGTGQVPPGTPIGLRAGIRSGEADGAATGNPAGYVGGLLTLKCANATGCTVAAGPVVVPSGTIVCTVGPSAATSIPLPDGTTTSQFVQKVQAKLARVPGSTGSALTAATTDSSVNPLQGASVTAANGPLADAANFGCKAGTTAGEVYTVTAQAQFVDPPTSLTPALTD